MPPSSDQRITGSAATPQVELDQIQGLVLREYEMGFAKYLFYGWNSPDQGRRWLKTLLSQGITFCAPWPSHAPEHALNVALTFQGLKALGLAPASLATFPEEFRLGMAGRATILGDYDKSAPSRWEEGWRSSIHAVVLIHGTQPGRRDGLASTVAKVLNGTGATMLFEQDARELDGGKEHFGFKDGISQPWVNAAGVQDHPTADVKGGGKWTAAGWQPLKAGEFVLGYEDESGPVQNLPSPVGLGRNGSYLVVRKLGKDVEQFHLFMKEQAERLWPGDRDADKRLAALMMGRWQDGTPVDKAGTANDFHYDDDPSGARCPLGAHIRRTNLREDTGTEGSLGSHRHRIIRRGLHYEDSKSGTRDRGSMFIAACASISRQFEFLQQFWVNDGEFLGLDRDERDPIIGVNRDVRDRGEDGSHPERKRKFAMSGKLVPFVFDLPEFVTVRGGEYFFAPGRTALDGLADGKFCRLRANTKTRRVKDALR
jgi:Dyp-type peroxidase family